MELDVCQWLQSSMISISMDSWDKDHNITMRLGENWDESMHYVLLWEKKSVINMNLHKLQPQHGSETISKSAHGMQ